MCQWARIVLNFLSVLRKKGYLQTAVLYCGEAHNAEEESNFTTRTFAGSAGFNSNSKYTYEFMLELKNGEWEIVSSGQG